MASTVAAVFCSSLAWLGYITAGCMTVSFAYLAYRIIIAPRLSPLRHLPCPDQGPVLYRLFTEPTALDLARWGDEVAHNGLIRYYGILNRQRIYIAQCTGVKHLLYTDCYKYVKPRHQRELATNVAGVGLLVQEGDLHKSVRKCLSPAFSAATTKSLYPMLWSTTMELLASVRDQVPTSFNSSEFEEKRPSGTVVNITKIASAVALDLIGRFGSGVDFNSIQNPGEDFNKSYLRLFKATEHGQRMIRLSALIPMSVFMALPFRTPRAIRNTMSLLHRKAESIVSTGQQRVSLQQQPLNTQSGEKILPASPPLSPLSQQPTTTILDTFITSNRFARSALVQQTIHFLGAGHETTATTIAWTIHLLSHHPEIQAKLRAEVRASRIPPPPFSSGLPSQAPRNRNFDSNLENNDKDENFYNDNNDTTRRHQQHPSSSSSSSPTTESENPISESDFTSLKYLNAVLNESLRFYPVKHIIWRECISPSQIQGHSIPAGTIVTFSPWAMNRSVRHWGPTANVYDPDRWLDGRAADDAYAFLTFGGGVRRCIGEGYAKAQLRTVISGLVGMFDFSPALEGESLGQGGDHCAVTLFKMINGVKAKVRPVDGW